MTEQTTQNCQRGEEISNDDSETFQEIAHSNDGKLAMTDPLSAARIIGIATKLKNKDRNDQEKKELEQYTQEEMQRLKQDDLTREEGHQINIYDIASSEISPFIEKAIKQDNDRNNQISNYSVFGKMGKLTTNFLKKGLEYYLRGHVGTTTARKSLGLETNSKYKGLMWSIPLTINNFIFSKIFLDDPKYIALATLVPVITNSLSALYEYSLDKIIREETEIEDRKGIKKRNQKFDEMLSKEDRVQKMYLNKPIQAKFYEIGLEAINRKKTFTLDQIVNSAIRNGFAIFKDNFKTPQTEQEILALIQKYRMAENPESAQKLFEKMENNKIVSIWDKGEGEHIEYKFKKYFGGKGKVYKIEK